MADAIQTWTKCKLPPCICRLLAKTDDLLTTNEELQRKTRWSRKKLRRISRSANWKKITVGDMDRFLHACNLRPEHQRRYVWVLKRAWKSGGIQNMRHLRITPTSLWRAPMVAGLIKIGARALERELSTNHQ